ncbi:MAG: hypothetical protein HY507_00880 [Candidatus Zambryskibacteria bacterium]|nr:hypothetical protein [Candidatus Zambryskibacteria bacterium]
MNDIDKVIVTQICKEKMERYKKQFLVGIFGLLLILPPIILYFFIKWDPLFINSEGESIPFSI